MEKTLRIISIIKNAIFTTPYYTSNQTWFIPMGYKQYNMNSRRITNLLKWMIRQIIGLYQGWKANNKKVNLIQWYI